MASPGGMGIRLGILAIILMLHILIVAVIVAGARSRPDRRQYDTPPLTVIALEPRVRPTSPASTDHHSPEALKKPQQMVVSSGSNRDIIPAVGQAAAPSTNMPADSPMIQKEAPAPMPQTSAPGIPTQSVKEAYTRELWKHIAERRPRGMRLEGTAIVTFHVDAGGGVLSVEISKSSGNLNLDKVALRAVRQASPFPAPPPFLSADDLIFSVPIIFH